MGRYASALSRHPVASHAVGETAGEVMERLAGDDPDLLVCFVSPHFAGALDDLVAALRALLSPGVLVAASAVAVVGGSREVEDEPAVALFAACLPDVTLTPVGLHVEEAPDGPTVVGWPDVGPGPATLLLVADPFSFPVEGFLARLDEDRPELTVIGGMASAATRPGGNRLVLDDVVRPDGAVGVVLAGADVRSVVSQGCRPIGRPLVVTRAEGRRVAELAGRPALERLRETAAAATEAERELLGRGVHLGLVVDEHREELGRGDFLVRNVLGADPESGALTVGHEVEVDHTVQFHVRDAGAADEDLRELLAGESAEAALLFTCNGRGRRLFGRPDHDAGVVAELLGPVPVAGAFCAGEIGPVGGRSFVHGFTASLALFR